MIDFTGVSVDVCRAGWDLNVTALDVPTSGLSDWPFGCNASVITKDFLRFNVTANVTVGVNATGFSEIRVNSTDLVINYTDVLVTVTGDAVPQNWTSSDSYTIGLLGNGSVNVTNGTITASYFHAAERAPTEAECSGFTLFSDYCLLSEEADIGGGQLRTTYTYRAFINVTDAGTKLFPVYYHAPKNRFTNWASRDNSSENLTVNGSTANVSLASTGTVDMFVNTTYDNGSLSAGYYLYEVIWTRTTTVAVEGGESGGGGGGGGPQIVVVSSNGTVLLNPKDVPFILNAGEERNHTFVIRNPNETVSRVTVSFEPGDTGDESHRWALLDREGAVFTDEVIEVPGGTPLQPGTKEFTVLVRVPVNADNGTYRFHVVAQNEAGARTIAVARVDVGGFSFTAGLFDAWSEFLRLVNLFLGWEITLPKPVFGVGSFRVFHVVLVIGGITAATLVYRRQRR